MLIDAPSRVLTDRQADILNWIVFFTDRMGYPPTVREIGRQFRIMSPNGVTCHVRALERKGYIERDPRLSRSIRVIDHVHRRQAGTPPPEQRIEGVDFTKLFADVDRCVLVADDSLSHLAILPGDLVMYEAGEIVGVVRKLKPR